MMVQVSFGSSLGMESSYNHQVPLQWSTGPTFAMMIVLGSRRSDEDDEEVGSGGGYPGEEEYQEEEKEDNGSEDVGKKSRVDQIPLWKYVTRLGGGKGVGTT